MCIRLRRARGFHGFGMVLLLHGLLTLGCASEPETPEARPGSESTPRAEPSLSVSAASSLPGSEGPTTRAPGSEPGPPDPVPENSRAEPAAGGEPGTPDRGADGPLPEPAEGGGETAAKVSGQDVPLQASGGGEGAVQPERFVAPNAPEGPLGAGGKAEAANESAELGAARAYEDARRVDTIEGFERFLERYPDSANEQAAAERLEALCFEQAQRAGTLEAYKQFLYRFPLSRRTDAVLAAVDPVCSLRGQGAATVSACRELLGLLPYSERKAQLLAWVHGAEENLKAERVGYEKHLTAPSEYAGVCRRVPLQDAGRGETRVSNVSIDAIWSEVEAYHRKHRIDHPAANPRLERLHHFFLTYDLVSRLRFHRGVDAFPGHHGIPEIGTHIVEQRWFEEYLAKVTANPKYNYKESYPVRVILAIHTAAHFFQLPFPTLFCLLFQESKFDFTVTSGVGAVGLGQLTPIGVQQIEKLRDKTDYEERLQAATAHLGRVYRDEGIHRILDRLGFEHSLPALAPRFPETVGNTFPKAINAEFVKEVAEILQRKGLPYGSDLSLVRSNCRLLSRGIMPPDRLADIQGVYHEVMERRFGRELGNIYNPETNIFYSALLLRYYMKYRWCISGHELELRPLVRSMAAVVSYNQGQTGVRRYLERVQQEFPGLDLNEATLEQCRTLFTKERLAVHHPGKKGTVEEVYRHATSIGTCSCRPPETNG